MKLFILVSVLSVCACGCVKAPVAGPVDPVFPAHAEWWR